MQYSRVLAFAAFFGLVPGLIVATYLAADLGYYQSTAIPIVFGVAFALAMASLFVVLPIVKEHLD